MRSPETKSNSAPTMASAPVTAWPRFPVWLMAALLALVTLAMYWPAMSHDFVNYDDDLVVTSNVHVQNGLTLANVKWAFFNPVNNIWHPLTMLSHMLDCQLFGLKPWGHHLTSVLLHGLNAALVFALLQQLTGATLRSLFVAALFAVHPLHVESVAWVAERKNVLSTCFGLLALIFYARYARKRSTVESREPKVRGVPALDPSARRSEAKMARPSTLDYGLVLFFFALGLMSKPMLVTWPFVMLLLDYWPLERFKSNRAWLLVAEKIPLFTLAAVASIVTFEVQKQTGALAVVENLPLGARGGNALISYCRYLGKLFWPTDLAVFYPHPGYWPLGQVVLAGGLILGITVLFIVTRGRYPFLLMGWLWFCGTLVPVIGMVQVGEQAMADRYAYIPSLGVLILTTWGAYELTRRWRYHVMALSVAGSAVIILCLGLTRQQLGYWKDSEALYRHVLAVTENNYLAHNNLGVALAKKGQTDEAINQYQEAIRLKPDFVDACNNLGLAFAKKGQTDEAISQFQEVIRLKPDYAEAHNNLGNALMEKGQINEAINQYQEVIRLAPNRADACNNLGNALVEKGQIDEAIRKLQEAIRLAPDYAATHNNLGIALMEKGKINEAISQFQEAIRLTPDFANAHFNLGIALDRKGQTDEAISQYQKAIRLKPDYAKAYNNLGTILGIKGQTDEAINQYQEAIRLAPDYVEAHYNLGTILGMKGQTDGAISQFQEVIRLKPDYAEAHNNLGNALGRKGRTDEAISQYQEAIRLKPDYAEAHNNLARALKMKNAPAGR